ncbi:lachesin-like isoform X2 [Venturia canescens]|uniref:lachesin-like isoform X2 n=1 Tax=Venturia canescens TaxID=32260 RepID=UPI001C9D3814|nr:lachesin-like isoform X2 [Venturia canescens]
MSLIHSIVQALYVVALVSTLVEGRRTRNLDILGGVSNHHIPLLDTVEDNDNHGSMPKFAEPISNVTVSIGRDALLACVVDNLQRYQVAWVRVDTQTILSIHDNVITQNPRISLTYNDHRSWYLHIKEAQEVDRGWYMCQINTDPMRSIEGYLQVVVPPSIIEKETSTDMVVREASNVTLTCKAKGYPEPYVMWRREDGKRINYNGEHVNMVDGEVLHIVKISRLHMGEYMCIASNQVPPSVSTRVSLKVQFPPMLSIPNQLEGAYVGQDVTLECHTEAYPTSINYWTTEAGDMIVSGYYHSIAGDKYEAIYQDNGYNKYMMLKIRNVEPKDFGSYKCVAQNSLGGTDGVIRLDEIPAPSTTTTQPTSQVTSSLKKPGRHGNKKLRQRPNDYEVEEWRGPDYDREYGGGGSGVGSPTKRPQDGETSGSPSCHSTRLNPLYRLFLALTFFLNPLLLIVTRR